MVSSANHPIQVDLNLQNVFDFNAFCDQKSSDIMAATWQPWIKTWLEALKPNLPPADTYELTLRLTEDLEIQTLNAQYRQKNQPTDVLAFAALEVDFPVPAEEIAALEPLYLGDIIISVETANKQAQQNHHSLLVELAWLAAHGLLHLLGWDHPDEDSLEAMLSQQETLLTLVGLQANG
ncbi:protein of unknown function UPF0054 [Rippkaea orientalis PCC 8801]|uniref:Endoribonuclease YbeY n=1 Tax=Rippkaea orientalis (strain PCC 8801 / RF-1) TaxID=41431 RepID=B7K199_RIPO1|nr:rRNA maturation RNase YbeY [Rippkaea orientalis]ACK66294.1 protein of unknown function UPF0054 [Rippkaea orientalis PCC 8801]